VAAKRSLTESINGTTLFIDHETVRIFNGREITLSLYGIHAKQFMNFVIEAQAFIEAERIRNAN
jgi:hypothetical protein